MRSEDFSAVSEDSLLREAQSFGDVLELLRGRGHVPEELIDNPYWTAVTQRAGELRATVAAFPFAFEVPLHDRRPTADLGVSILGGSRTAASIGHESGAPYLAGIAGLLREMDRKESALRRITDWEVMLAYDIGIKQPGARPDPAVFLSSIGRPLSGGGSRRLADIGVLFDSMARAARWESGGAERREVERLYRALSPGTRIETVGVFPARDWMIRVEMNGFRTGREVLAFLERIDWPGERAPIGEALQPLEARGAFRRLGIHLNVRADGFRPELGINLSILDERPKHGRYWLDKAGNWAPLITALGEDGLAVPGKLSALSRWPGARIVSGRFGVFVLVCGIHHFELVPAGGRFEQVRAYAYMFLRSMPREAWALASLSG